MLWNEFGGPRRCGRVLSFRGGPSRLDALISRSPKATRPLENNNNNNSNNNNKANGRACNSDRRIVCNGCNKAIHTGIRVAEPPSNDGVRPKPFRLVPVIFFVSFFSRREREKKDKIQGLRTTQTEKGPEKERERLSNTPHGAAERIEKKKKVKKKTKTKKKEENQKQMQNKWRGLAIFSLLGRGLSEPPHLESKLIFRASSGQARRTTRCVWLDIDGRSRKR